MEYLPDDPNEEDQKTKEKTEKELKELREYIVDKGVVLMFGKSIIKFEIRREKAKKPNKRNSLIFWKIPRPKMGRGVGLKRKNIFI